MSTSQSKTPADLETALAAAEKELDALSEQVRVTYRAYVDADNALKGKVAEVQVLKRQIREAAAPEPVKETAR